MADNIRFEKSNSKCEVKTTILNKTYEFNWAVENFPQWPKTFKVTSEDFQPANDIILCATLERFKDDSGVFQSYINLASKGMTSFKMKHFISIVGSDGKVFQDIKPFNFIYKEVNNSIGYDIYPNKITEFSNSTKDQTVIFKFVLEIRGLTTRNVHRSKHLPPTDLHLPPTDLHLPPTDSHLQSPSDLLVTLAKDFKSMYADSFFTDLTLLVENSVLRVHKSVLCARSPVFAKMLKSPMDEKEKDVIKIPDIELPIMKSFVEFLYTGDMPDAEFESVYVLYYAADKYDVPSLQKACAKVLLEELEVENACRVLSLAHRHSDKQLKDLVLDFMQLEFDTILGTESWIDFVKVETDLAVEVMKLRGQKFEKGSSSLKPIP